MTVEMRGLDGRREYYRLFVNSQSIDLLSIEVLSRCLEMKALAPGIMGLALGLRYMSSYITPTIAAYSMVRTLLCVEQHFILNVA